MCWIFPCSAVSDTAGESPLLPTPAAGRELRLQQGAPSCNSCLRTPASHPASLHAALLGGGCTAAPWADPHNEEDALNPDCFCYQNGSKNCGAGAVRRAGAGEEVCHGSDSISSLNKGRMQLKERYGYTVIKRIAHKQKG